MTAPLVSVVIPAFEARPWVEDTIDSVLAQTHPRVEIIVVDDGSTDGTGTFVRERYGADVACIRQENAGLAAARNAGLEVASGRYVQFLDADDLLLPQKIARHVEILEENPGADVVYCDFEYVNADGSHAAHELRPFFRAGRILRPLLRRNFIVAHAPLSRLSALREVGGFDEHLRACEDYDLWLRLAADGRTFLFDDEVRVLYRRRSDSMSAHHVRQAASTAQVLRRAMRRPLPLPADRLVLLRHLAGVSLHHAFIATRDRAARWIRS